MIAALIAYPVIGALLSLYLRERARRRRAERTILGLMDGESDLKARVESLRRIRDMHLLQAQNFTREGYHSWSSDALERARTCEAEIQKALKP